MTSTHSQMSVTRETDGSQLSVGKLQAVGNRCGVGGASMSLAAVRRESQREEKSRRSRSGRLKLHMKHTHRRRSGVREVERWRNCGRGAGGGRRRSGASEPRGQRIGCELPKNGGAGRRVDREGKAAEEGRRKACGARFVGDVATESSLMTE